MRTRKGLYLTTTVIVAGAFVLASEAPIGAQSAGSTSAPPSSESDPPALVGRLAFTQGTVSFRTADEDRWQPATLNYPVTNGQAFWTEPQALAEIEAGASRIWMDGATELDVTTLDEQKMLASEPEGEIYLRLSHLVSGQSYTIETPRGIVTLARDGRYEVVAGDTARPTTVTVVEGAAEIGGNNLSLEVGPSQTATISGADTFQGSVGPMAADQFLVGMEQREQQAVAAAQPSQAAPPAIAQQMTGGEELQRYGTWRSSPDYGAVWYPQVEPGWAPYEEGSWDYVAPWGWTWVSSEPWGFAPFHYGRWAYVDGRWGWIPGSYAEAGPGVYEWPVYAPALVAFFGLGVVTGGALAGDFREVGWVPLAPGEPYHPWYRADDRYFRAVNRFNVRNLTEIERERAREIAVDRFANRRAAVVVPAAIMAQSRNVRAGMHRLASARLAEAHPVIGRPPIGATAATVGVTPRLARELKLPGRLPIREPAPGPRTDQTVFHHVPERHALPTLRPAMVNPAAPPTVGREAPEAEHRLERMPGAPGVVGLPALRAPNFRPAVPGEAHGGGPKPGRERHEAVVPRGPEGLPHAPGAPLEGLPELQAPGAPPGARHEHIPGAPRVGELPPNVAAPAPPGGMPHLAPHPAPMEHRARPGHEALAAPELRVPHPLAPVVVNPAPVPHPAPVPRFALPPHLPPPPQFAPAVPHVAMPVAPPPHVPEAMPRVAAPVHVAPPPAAAAPHPAPPPRGGPPPRKDEHQ